MRMNSLCICMLYLCVRVFEIAAQNKIPSVVDRINMLVCLHVHTPQRKCKEELVKEESKEKFVKEEDRLSNKYIGID